MTSPAQRRERRRVWTAKATVWAVGLGALGWLGFAAATDRLGANPIETLLHYTGRWALIVLIASLAITPLRGLTGWNGWIRARRLVGLWAFAFAFLHFSTYLGLDQFFAFSYILEDVAERPFITSGFAAFVLLVPLAATSTRGWIRRLGKRWTVLHRLVYPASILAVVHYYWKVKADARWPLVAALALAALLGFRIFRWAKTRNSGSAKG